MSTTGNAQADRMIAAAREGRSSFFKDGDRWLILTPGHHRGSFGHVDVTKADGTTKTVMVTDTIKTNTQRGVDYTIAEFMNIAPAPVAPAQPARKIARDGGYYWSDQPGATYYDDAIGGHTQVWDHA